MAEHITNRKASGTARAELFALQVEQHQHDEIYHREIARLSLHQRLNHMALHFAKYTGKIAVAKDSTTLSAVYVDVLIIALSTANVVNVELFDLLERDGREFAGLPTFARSLAADMQSVIGDRHVLLRETAVAAGRMAAACEKIDHLEEISFRAEIGNSIAQFGSIALAVLSLHGIDPVQAVRDRLGGVKERLKLHGRI
jgi:hypothetical protein